MGLGKWNVPVRKNPLTLASEMIEQFGQHAEMLAADNMDAALQTGDGESYDHWCLVAKAIALLTRHHPEPVKTKTKRKAPVEEPGLLKRMRG